MPDGPDKARSGCRKTAADCMRKSIIKRQEVFSSVAVVKILYFFGKIFFRIFVVGLKVSFRGF